MATGNKWLPEHYRRGCWVGPYRRRDGTEIKRHWRAGSTVRGHFAAAAPGTPNHKPRPRSAKPIALNPSPNSASLALALHRQGRYRPAPRQPKGNAIPEISLNRVSWTTDCGARREIAGLPLKMGLARLPETAQSISLEAGIAFPGGETTSIILEADVFINPDHTICVTPEAVATPREISQAVRRVSPAATENSPAGVKFRNEVRKKLGAGNPEQAMQDAAGDMLKLAPLPQLDLTRPVTVTDPNTGLLVTISPSEKTTGTPSIIP